jgi:hypothetical protein
MYETANRVRVAHAWKQGEAYSQSNMHTDGRTLYSYGHPIGITEEDGTKVAYACAASPTTGKHGCEARAIADRVEACPVQEPHSQAIAREVRMGRLLFHPGRRERSAWTGW